MKVTMQKSILFLICYCVLIAPAWSQQGLLKKKGDKKYEKYDFYGAIEAYSQLQKKDEKTYRRLAESYRYVGNTVEAEHNYSVCVQTGEFEPTDLYFYAAMLQSNGKVEESDEWMRKFYAAVTEDSRGKEFKENNGFSSALLKDDGRYNVQNLAINSHQEDFGPSYFKDKIVFASSREGTKSIQRRWNWNKLPFLDLYVASPTDDNQLTNVKPLDQNLNNKYHEGPASFAQDGKFMAFTRNNYFGRSSDDIIKLQIFTEEYVDGRWENEKAFPYNSPEYSVGHASLSPDGQIMYFASDMPGGIGQVDIYKTTRTSNGWSKPVNLGPKINTEGNEMFPFYHPNGFLIFASDGHVGLGGLDNFIIQITEDGFGEILNMGYPLNDLKDDFAVTMDAEMKNGYFSSNRPGGKGDDDIYSFQLKKPFIFGKTIKGVAKDESGEILSGVLVKLEDEDGIIIGTITTEDDGSYAFSVEEGQDFKLFGAKNKYFEATNTVSTETEDSEIVVDLTLARNLGISLYCLVTDKESGDPLEGVRVEIINNSTGKLEVKSTPGTGDFRKPLPNKKLNDRINYSLKLTREGYMAKSVKYIKQIDREGQYNIHEDLDLTMDKLEIGMDIAKIININPIYFDVNKSNIREDAAVELEKIVKVMNENPTMEIELGSHTDCRASAKYNMALSDRRAKSSAKYIQERITNPNRIYGKGYGESDLINQCQCEGNKVVPCTEEEHQDNRRTEFKIIKM